MRLLDSALLAQLEGRWQQQGAEIAGCLAPGLTVDEIDTLVAPLGLDLPQEARTWWGWHNGVTVATPLGWEIGPDIGFYSLAQALDEYRYTIATRGDDGWPSDWLPLVQYERGPLAIDCGGADEEPVRVHRVNWEIGNLPGAPSMAEMVTTWIETIDSGGWTWNVEGGYWDRDPAHFPPSQIDRHIL